MEAAESKSELEEIKEEFASRLAEQEEKLADVKDERDRLRAELRGKSKVSPMCCCCFSLCESSVIEIGR